MSHNMDLAGFSAPVSTLGTNSRTRGTRVNGNGRLRSAPDPTLATSAMVMDILDAEDCDDFPRAVCRTVHENLPVRRVSFSRLNQRTGKLQAACWPPIAVEPAPITDLVRMGLRAPQGIALEMTIERTDGRFTEGEKAALRTMRHCLETVIRNVGGAHLDEALCSVGWTRIVAQPNGEVIACQATGDRPRFTPGQSLTSARWWGDLRTVLVEDPVLTGTLEPTVHTIAGDGVTLLVERPLIGHPVIYLLDNAPHSVVDDAVLRMLTARQAEVARLLVDGMSAKEVAASLHISLATARSHIEHVYRRLGVKNRAQAVGLLLGRDESG